MASGSRFLLLLCLSSGLLATASCWSSSCSVRRCPTGWTQRGYRCFMYHHTAKSWIDAERTCISLGGNLASVRYSSENNFLRSLIFRVSGSNRHVWIGGFDAVQERVWQWTDGSRFSYSRWARKEPNNVRGAEHCLVMNWSGQYWNDWRCTNRNSFVCSRNV